MAKILVAGSDSCETQTRALLLEFNGHQCATAGSVAQAVRILKSESPFAAIIADQNLRGGKASGILKRLGHTVATEPALMVLAPDAKVPIQADQVLLIPCLPDNFYRAVGKVLAHRARRSPSSLPSRTPPKGLSEKKRVQCA